MVPGQFLQRKGIGAVQRSPASEPSSSVQEVLPALAHVTR